MANFSQILIGGTGVSPVLAQAKACGYIFHLSFLAAHAKCLPDTTGAGGLNKGLIIPLNPPLGKGDLHPDLES